MTKRQLTDHQKDLINRARAVAANRKIVDATTAIIVELCNEIAGEQVPLPTVEGSTDSRTANLTRYFGGKK